MEERNTRPVRVSSSRAVRPASASGGSRSANNTPKKKKPAGAGKKFTAQTALIIAVAAVLLICVPLIVYTATAEKRENTPGEENIMGIEPAKAAPTGEEETLLAGYLQTGEQTVEDGDEDPDAPDTTTGNDTATYQKGDSGAEIARMQSRLMALGYMQKDETTDYFGSATESALKLFQKVQGMEQNGIATAEVRQKLFAESTSFFTLQEGSKNLAVMELQKKLASMKYLSAEATGYFGTETAKAVKSFQEKNSLTVDGKVGLATWNRLNSSDAIKADAAQPTKSPEKTE